jgi:hypothetical protein
MADFNSVYQPVLNTSAQPTGRENSVGIPNEWSRAGDMHGVARLSAIPGLAGPLVRNRTAKHPTKLCD